MPASTVPVCKIARRFPGKKSHFRALTSEQAKLSVAFGRNEPAAVEPRLIAVETAALAGQTKTVAEQVCPWTKWLHPGEEARIVIASVPDRADDRHDLAGAVGVVNFKPLTKQRRNLMRQAQHDPAGCCHAARRRFGQDGFDELIGDRRDYRSHRNVSWNSGLGQPAQRLQPFGGRAGPWLEQARKALTTALQMDANNDVGQSAQQMLEALPQSGN